MAKRKALRKHDAKPLGFKTDAEKLIACLQGDVKETALSVKLTEKLERVITCKSLLFEHKFTSKVVEMLISTYKYSQVSAYRDIKLTTLVFGPILKSTKEMKRAIAEEMIRQDREMAIAKKDISGLNSSTANFIKLHQLDKEEVDLPDLGAFEFHQNIIAVLPEQVGVHPVGNEELLQNLEDWISHRTEDISHEELG